MLTLESAIAITLAILLVFSGISLAPPLYLMTRQAARLEVLSVYEALSGSALYQTGSLQQDEARISGLQTSPQKVLELTALVRDYLHWGQRWIDGFN